MKKKCTNHQKEKAHTCSKDHQIRERYKKHKQSERKSFYMLRESLCNEKDMKSTYNRKEKAFTCGENHFITRKRLNNYTRNIIWLHPVKSLSRGVGQASSRFLFVKKFKAHFTADYYTFIFFTKNELKFITDGVKSCIKIV